MQRIAILLLCLLSLGVHGAGRHGAAAQELRVQPAGTESGSAMPADSPAATPPPQLAVGRSSNSVAADSLAIPLQRDRRDASAGEGGGVLTSSLPQIAGALAVTLGLFAVVVVISRRGGGSMLRGLPREAFEVIGQTTVGPRQRLIVVRLGTQAVLIGASPAGLQRIAQIEDPDEAGQFIAQCRGTGAAASFRNTLRDMEREPASPGFLGDAPARPPGAGFFLRA